MTQVPGARVFDFFQLEERVLLSGDSLDAGEPMPDPSTALLDSLISQIASEGLPDHEFSRVATTASAAETSVSDSLVTIAEHDDASPPDADSLMTPTRLEVIFVDSAVENGDRLISDLQSHQSGEINWIVYHLESGADGIDQITDALAGLGDVDAVHLLSHGDGTGLKLGNTRIDDQSLAGYAGQFVSWNDSMDEDADLLIYGCNLASTELGRNLLESIAGLCDCDVAASDDITGHESLNGDWILEFQTGEVETEIAITTQSQATWIGTLMSPVDTAPTDLIVIEATSGGLSVNESGNDTYYVSSNGLDANLDRFTYEIRFAADGYSGEQVFLSYNVGNEDHLSFQLVDSGNRLELDIGAGRQLYSSAIDYYAALVDTQDHTLSISWDNGLGDWQIYIDGALIDSGAGFQVGEQVQSGGTLMFGQEQDTENGHFNSFQHFRGVLYEARLFNDVRTTAEIATHYAGSVSRDEDGLISNWNFEGVDTNGIIADDVGGLVLTKASATGSGFFADNATLVFAVQENSSDGTPVGQVQAVDAERDALITNLLATDPDLVYSATTANFYKLVNSGLSWDEAFKTGATSPLFGIDGQLVTIRSEYENQIVTELAEADSVDVWIGGTDRASEGEFRWLESGIDSDTFWTGGPTGSADGESYANFVTGQPDDLAEEDFVQLHHANGQWSDQANSLPAAAVIEWDADDALDGAQAIDYQILSQSVAGAFAIDSDDGSIVVADGSLLDFDSLIAHTVTVRSTDVSGNHYDESFIIEIVENNQEQSLDVAGPLTVNEGETVTITNAILSTSDPDQPADQLRYIVTDAPRDGQVLLAGSVIGEGQTFTQQDILDGLVRFSHGGTHDLADGFDFVVDDRTGAVSSGTVSIYVNLVDDPVEVTAPSTIVTSTDVPVQFGAFGASEIGFFDEEAGTITAGLSVTQAQLSFVAGPGLTVIDGDGTDGSLRFSGSQSQVNAALDSLRLTPDAGFNGPIELVVSASDASMSTLHLIDIVIAPASNVLIWDGGGTTDNWTDPLNWDLDRIPRADDTVVFDATNVSNSTIDLAYAGAIATVHVDASYMGIISQSIDLSVTDRFHVRGGTYDSNGFSLDLDGNWNATGGIVDLSGSAVSVAGNMTQTSTLASVGSTFTFDGTNSQTLSSTQAFDDVVLSGGESMNLASDLIVDGDFLNTNSGFVFGTNTLVVQGAASHTIDSGGIQLGNVRLDTSGTVQLLGDVDVAGRLTISNATTINGGDFLSSGEILITDSTWTGTTGIELVGSADQSISASGGIGAITELVINKTGGLVTIDDAFMISGNIDLIAGAVDASQLDLVLTSGSSATIDGSLGPIGSLEIDASSAKTISGTLDVLAATTFTQIALLNGGTIRALGDVNAFDNVYSGTTVLQLGGSADQTIATAGGTGMIRNLEIDKTGGTALAVENLELAGSVRYIGGNLDADSIVTKFISINLSIDTGTLSFGDVEFAVFVSADIVGTLNVDGDVTFNQVFFIDGGEIAVTGDVDSFDATVLGTASVRLTGAGDQTISNRDLPDGDLVIDKPSGNVFLADDLDLNGTDQDLNLVRGDLVLSGQTIGTTGAVTITGGQLSGYGTITGHLGVGPLGEISLDASNAAPLGQDQIQVGGNLRIASGARLTLDVTGISSGGLISDLFLYSTRTGQFDNIQLNGNSAGFIPYAIYDDASGTLGVFLNTAPTGTLPDLNVVEDSPNSVVDLAAAMSDGEQSTNSFSYSLVSNDNPSLFDSLSIDQATGTFTLDYAADQHGSANLTLRVADPFGDSTDVSFSVSVTPQDDAPTLSTGSLVAGEGEIVKITPSQLNANDIDTDSDQLVYTITDFPARGFVRVDGAFATTFTQQQIDQGRVTYEHDDTERFTDSISVRLSDGSSTLATQTIAINMTPVNDQPVVITSDGGTDAATVSVTENSRAVTSVATNDADLPGDAILYSISGGSDAAKFTIDSSTGVLEFISAPDAESTTDFGGDGIYEVTVMANDGRFSDTQSISVAIIDVDEFDVQNLFDLDASANEFDVSAPAGTSIGITVFASDADTTNSSISYSLVNDDGGRFNIDPLTGEIRTAASFDFSADGPTRSIVVRATSADSSFLDQTFTVDLLNSNVAPVATNDSFLTTAGSAFEVSAPGLLVNDFDIDGNSLAAVLVTGPGNGSVTLGPGGNFTYTPGAGFVGTDVFEYSVNDGALQSNTAQVRIQVIVGGGVTTTGGSGTGAGVKTGRLPELPETSSGSGGALSLGSPQHSGDADLSSPFDDREDSAADSGFQSNRDAERSTEDNASTSSSEESGDSVSKIPRTAARPTNGQSTSSNQSSSENASQRFESENAASIQMVYQSLFVGGVQDQLELAESSQQIRQLERLLELDLKQAILWDMWDNNDLVLKDSPATMFIGSAGAAAGLFSIGYVMWALRGGAFVSVIASSLPSWRIVDPTALLTAYRSTSGVPGEGLNDIIG